MALAIKFEGLIAVRTASDYSVLDPQETALADLQTMALESNWGKLRKNWKAQGASRGQNVSAEKSGVYMEKAIQIFASVNFLVIGLSHLFQRKVWVDYFAKLHSLGKLGPFAEGFLYLNFGALIVSCHNVWTFPEIGLTLIGWVLVLKALFRFIAPAAVLKIYQRMGRERAWQIQVAGAFMLPLSVFLMFRAFGGT